MRNTSARSVKTFTDSMYHLCSAWEVLLRKKKRITRMSRERVAVISVAHVPTYLKFGVAACTKTKTNGRHVLCAHLVTIVMQREDVAAAVKSPSIEVTSSR